MAGNEWFEFERGIQVPRGATVTVLVCGFTVYEGDTCTGLAEVEVGDGTHEIGFEEWTRANGFTSEEAQALLAEIAKSAEEQVNERWVAWSEEQDARYW